DGSKIAFVEGILSDQTTFEIWVMNANDGSNATQLTHNSAIDNTPNFSPDGSKIVFASAIPGDQNHGDIWVMNADGSNPIDLTNDYPHEFYPTFSPDGSKIAYSIQPDLDSNVDIYVMNADGSGQTPLVEGPVVDSLQSWGSQADSDGDGIGDA